MFVVGAIAVTPGYDFFVDASADTDADQAWEDLTPWNPSGLELLLSDTPAVTRVAVSSSTRILYAYDFPGGSTGNVAGAQIVYTATTNPASFQDTPVDWSTNALTLEIWFRPDVIAPTPTNGYTVFEDGGGSGLGLFIVSNKLACSQDFLETEISYDLETDPSGVLLGNATNEFMQAVIVRDNIAPYLTELYLNAVKVGQTNDDDNDWSGGDDAAFGTRGGANTGGKGSGQLGTESFDGQIAMIRMYSDQLLSPSEITNNFNNVKDPDVTGPDIISTTPPHTFSYASVLGDLVVSFDEAIQLVNGGTVTIRNMDLVSDEIITVPSAQLSVSGAALTIDPTNNFDYQTTYAVQISPGALIDLYANSFTGITDFATWSFTTAEEASTVTWDGVASGDAIWTEPDINSWSGSGYNSGDTAQFLGAGSGAVTVHAGGVSPAAVIVNASSDYTFSGGSIGGTGSVSKAGSGALTLSSSNAFTGDITLGGGEILFSIADAWGGSGKSVFVTNNATLRNGFDGYSGGELAVSSGATAFVRAERSMTFSSASGSGQINYGNGEKNKVLTLSDASLFTGTILNYCTYNGGMTVQFQSLGESVAGGHLQFGGEGSSDNNQQGTFRLYGNAGPLIMNHRQIQIKNPTSKNAFRYNRIENNNGSPANKWVINTPLSNQVTGKDVEVWLQGSNTGDNEFAGEIQDGPGSVKTKLFKGGNGTWILSGTNSYEGITQVTSGTLVLRGESAVLDTGTVNVSGGILQIDDREMIGTLQFAGVAQTNGVWGATGSGAENINDTYLSGNERLYVGVEFPPSGTVFIVE
jgi:autotransporter-associated beta strand protein